MSSSFLFLLPVPAVPGFIMKMYTWEWKSEFLLNRCLALSSIYKHWLCSAFFFPCAFCTSREGDKKVLGQVACKLHLFFHPLKKMCLVSLDLQNIQWKWCYVSCKTRIKMPCHSILHYSAKDIFTRVFFAVLFVFLYICNTLLISSKSPVSLIWGWTSRSSDGIFFVFFLSFL